MTFFLVNLQFAFLLTQRSTVENDHVVDNTKFDFTVDEGEVRLNRPLDEEREVEHQNKCKNENSFVGLFPA